jgi:hypothetical protein
MTEQNKKNQRKPTDRVPDNPYRESDYRTFVKFYAMPSIFRDQEYGFRTETDFAKNNNLNRETLTEWKKMVNFRKDVDNQLLKWGADKTPDVIASLFRTILKEGKASEVKLWLQYIKNWKEGTTVETTIKEDNPLIDILDKLDEESRNKIISQLKADEESEE